MKLKLFISTLFLSLLGFCKAQDSAVVFHSSMPDKNFQLITLGDIDGWVFKEGNDTSWANKNIDAAGWRRFRPAQLTIKNADSHGKVEGWFRLKFILDSSFRYIPAGFVTGTWAAIDIYINGIYVGSSGNTGWKGKPFQENPWDVKTPRMPGLQSGVENILAVHIVEYRSPFNSSLLKSELIPDKFTSLISLTGAESHFERLTYLKELSNFWSIMLSVLAVLTLLFWLLFFQNSPEKVLLTISIATTFFTAATYCELVINTKLGLSFTAWSGYSYIRDVFYGIAQASGVIVLAQVFRRKISSTIIFFALTLAFLPIINNYVFNSAFRVPYAIYLLFVDSFLVVMSWKNLKGSQWIVVTGMIITTLWNILFQYNSLKYSPLFPFPFAFVYLAGIFLSFPLSLMIYVASRFKEILIDVQKNAQQVMQLLEEKKEQALKQQKMLEEEVAKQTIELRTAFDHLKSTQSQLIQSEKMASLGELTAGIAHEIQNPLNFVNNFSEVNTELVDEATQQINSGNIGDAKTILNDIKENQQKINHHGKRADAIVKGMLQHSRTGSGQKELTDINALADEYLRLAYHGLRAKDKTFKAKLETDFDNSVGKINVIPQDIGRVLVNLINNAFYAVSAKASDLSKTLPDKLATADSRYEPTVTISTKKLHDSVEIRVRDNGKGIPQKVLDKIFQPFFTTKPTGQGTGLGLSLAYDIVKAHGGELKVATKEGEGTEFIIELKNITNQ